MAAKAVTNNKFQISYETYIPQVEHIAVPVFAMKLDYEPRAFAWEAHRQRCHKSKVYQDWQDEMRKLIFLDLYSLPGFEMLQKQPLELRTKFCFDPPELRNPAKSRTFQPLDLNWFHFVKPDLTNAHKAIEDCGTGLIYKDDSCICKMSSEKIWAAENAIYVELLKLERV